jgi:hypothetical protein
MQKKSPASADGSSETDSDINSANSEKKSFDIVDTDKLNKLLQKETSASKRGSVLDHDQQRAHAVF